MYMRQVEPWLDATGWGATWPSLEDREPEDQGYDPVETERGPKDQVIGSVRSPHL